MDAARACWDRAPRYGTLLRYFGWICITIGWGLIVGVTVAYFHDVVPLLFTVRSRTGLLMLVPMTWLSFNLMFNYYMAIWTPPGRPTATLTDEEAVEMSREAAPQKGKGWAKFCKHCRLPKPPRSHHCHTCGTCVLKMDHHCPWINSCVGYHNHRYFTLLVLYLALNCLFAVCTLLLHYFGFLQSDYAGDEDAATATLIFVFVICALVFVAMFGFFGWNMYLVLTNQTTIEFHFNKCMAEQMRSRGEIYMNPYDMGLQRNLATVFGPAPSMWRLLLPSALRLPGDGTKWATIHEHH